MSRWTHWRDKAEHVVRNFDPVTRQALKSKTLQNNPLGRAVTAGIPAAVARNDWRIPGLFSGQTSFDDIAGMGSASSKRVRLGARTAGLVMGGYGASAGLGAAGAAGATAPPDVPAVPEVPAVPVDTALPTDVSLPPDMGGSTTGFGGGADPTGLGDPFGGAFDPAAFSTDAGAVDPFTGFAPDTAAPPGVDPFTGFDQSVPPVGGFETPSGLAEGGGVAPGTPPGVPEGADYAKNAFRYGIPALGAVGGIMQRRAAMGLANQYRGLASAQRGAGEDLVAQYRSGKLNQADQYAIDQWEQGAIAQTKDYYARASLSDSSMAKNAEASIHNAAVARKQEALNNLLTMGTNILNITDRYQAMAVQAELAANQALGVTAINFMAAYGNYLRYFG